MTSDTVKTRDEAPRASVNAEAAFAGTYRVTADKGITVSGHDGKTYKKGDKVELNGDAARALLNDGSIERA